MEVNKKMKHTIKAVSYTHLDVYKRQVVLDIAEVIAAKKAWVPFKKAFKDEAEWSLSLIHI